MPQGLEEKWHKEKKRMDSRPRTKGDGDDKNYFELQITGSSGVP